MFKNNRIANSVKCALLLAAGSSLAFTSNITMAQEAEDSATVEKISVTGSRIKREDLVATSPINIIDEVAIEISGANNVAQFLNELPSAGIPGTTDSASNFRTTTSGINTVNLRNLNSNRTLVLVNGRRHVGGNAGSPTVDVSMIPVNLVERVEIVTGGASAVYGSEAITGVINFIMKDDFEGIEITGRMGASDLGGADETDFTLTAGGNFDDDKGNAVIHLSYSDRGILNSRDRELSANDATNSTFGPKGNFFVPGTGFVTQDDNTGLWDKNFVAAEDGFNRNQVRIIRVPTTRTQFSANVTYEINEHFNFFSESTYVESQAESRLEPSIVGDFVSVGNSVSNIRIPIENPFIPPELLSAVQAASPGATEIQMFRRFVELGPRTSDVQRKVFRTAIGLEGIINDDFDYEVYYQYGNFGQDQTNGGVFNTLNFYNGLRVEDDGAGGFQCSDSFARDLGCVPINVFGAGSISGAALDWVSVDSQLTSRMDQQTFGATISGVAFELPAGDVGIAFGYEWREEESKFNSDSLAQSGLTSGNTTPNTVGEYDVNEFFVEAIVPLIADAPFAHYLGLELAYRTSDYSTIGSASTYKVSLDWSPIEDLKIRGGVSTAVRAPNIGELFNPGSETFRNFVDPCAFGGQGGTSSTGETYEAQSATVQANCATINGTATLDPFGLNIRSAGGLSAGNPNLNEEEADATTIGFVYTPSDLEGFSFTADYYKITIDNAINSFTAQTTVDQCVRQANFPNNPFCSLIQRDPNTGLVLRINALAINVAEFEASGVDFTADYAFDLGPGNLRLGVVGNHSLSNDFLPFSGGETVDSQGEIGAPDWKVNLNATYLWDEFIFSWSTRYLDRVFVENDQKENFGEIGSYAYHDFQMRYALGENGNYELYAGVDNIFDKEPPFLGQGVPGDITGTNTASDVYDAIRRYYYFGFQVNF
ncbi:TonB-dependent receptor plug domain-containing protein [Aliiglaciecola sp. M165]|uniref:TonB-dependent receptor plug domain-containing protein n=1 Tax=Aliiglaciecola sp. M165 TaxID=2593649 RepID=UPI00117CBF1E|nr:TonB-dependent receptor [Aliiglaciecola sp. M165]TRY31355.1 TonB-dependent receptor [Aliiglaciecola sp. M165]